MGRMTGIKWEKSTQCRPVHNIISSDFPKYNPQSWKFMEGPSRIQWLLSYEYQRMWLDERELWNKRMYPENTAVNVDIVKSYVLSFKTNHQPLKPEKKKPFKMKNVATPEDVAHLIYPKRSRTHTLQTETTRESCFTTGIDVMKCWYEPGRNWIGSDISTFSSTKRTFHVITFENVSSKTSNKRHVGDKAMKFEKNKGAGKQINEAK